MLNFALHAPLMPSVKCTFPDIYQQLLKCCYITHAFQGTCESTAGEQIITMQRGKNQGFFSKSQTPKNRESYSGLDFP